MNYLKELALILIFYLSGELIVDLLHLPVPGNIMGMLILLVALFLGAIKENQIKSIADFILGNLAFFFIPSAVALMSSYSNWKDQAVGIVFVVFTSTFFVMVVTGLTVQIARRWKKSDN